LPDEDAWSQLAVDEVMRITGSGLQKNKSWREPLGYNCV